MNQQPRGNVNRLNIWLPLLFALVLVAGMLIGMRLQSETPTVVIDAQGNNTPEGGKLEEILRYIDAKYVDNVSRDKLVDDAIHDILKQLDPHSNYIPSEHLQEVNEQLEGNFDGIGVEFLILEDTVVVVAPLAGGPAEEAGILASDKIIYVEDSLIAGVGTTSTGIMDLLRGERGSKVKISVLRGNEPKLRQFTLTRDEIPMHSIDVAYMLDNKTGYIKINRFSATTYEEFMKSLEKLVEKQGMKDLVIDLRQNPGGYLQQATNILSQLFKDKGKLLVYTEGRSVHRSDYESTGRTFYNIKNIAVLIDEGSASASEIMAGALQDHDRAYIIGRRSFGKGLVQEQYDLRDGSALRLTVARYFTPSGRSIQKSYTNKDEYDNDVWDRLESGELSSEERMNVADTTKYYTSSGRVVYGGGGIMPDVFVPIDTVVLNEYYAELRQHVPQFAYRYTTNNRSKFEYSSLEQFKRNFSVTDQMLNAFMDYAASQKVQKDPKQLAAIKPELKLYMKARFARQLFDDESFYKIWNEQDPVVRKALQTIYKSNPISEYQHKYQQAGK
ncbi:MAG: S41 family peptidase [Saprospiraceae bacterium]